MEKRIGVVAILITDASAVPLVNDLLHAHGQLVLSRQGLPLRGKGVNVISLIVEGSTEDIGALTGKAGKLSGVLVKSVLTAYREEGDEGPVERGSLPRRDVARALDPGPRSGSIA
jgi:putative iron-only hydrogenase system regulator